MYTDYMVGRPPPLVMYVVFKNYFIFILTRMRVEKPQVKRLLRIHMHTG